MKKYTFGVLWQMSGALTVDVPDEITTLEEARNWVKEHWGDMPIPTGGEYIPNSDTPDFDDGGDELEG